MKKLTSVYVPKFTRSEEELKNWCVTMFGSVSTWTCIDGNGYLLFGFCSVRDAKKFKLHFSL